MTIENREDFDGVWERVVCDEASSEDLQAVVADCELSPERYRELALSILEHRKLTMLLGGKSSDERSTNPSGAATPPPLGRAKRTCLETTNILIPWAVAACMTMVAASLAFSRNEARPGLNMPEMASSQPSVPGDVTSPRLVRVDGDPNESFREWVSPMAQPVFPRDLKTTIRGLGWDVRERAEIYVLEDESGNQYAVPDRDFEFYFMSDN
ncbi:MAG: hypothetical protein AAFX06_02055 [Planctomycetota bacterium]